MSPYISAASWYNPVSFNYYAAGYGTVRGAQMLSSTLSSMSRPSLAAVSVSPDYNTRAFALAYAGHFNTSALSARAAQGIGTILNVIA